LGHIFEAFPSLTFWAAPQITGRDVTALAADESSFSFGHNVLESILFLREPTKCQAADSTDLHRRRFTMENH
jgi:hypothetical protein